MPSENGAYQVGRVYSSDVALEHGWVQLQGITASCISCVQRVSWAYTTLLLALLGTFGLVRSLLNVQLNVLSKSYENPS